MLKKKKNRLAAYQFDSAVLTFGTIVENALQETVELGSGKHKTRRARWTLSQILDDKFKLPRRNEQKASVDSLRKVDGAFYDEIS